MLNGSLSPKLADLADAASVTVDQERARSSKEGVMALMRVRLELARNPDFPEGSSTRGYEFTAPLDAHGQLDQEGWRQQRNACVVRRFWAGEDDQDGHLVHHGGHRWALHYEGMPEPGDEPIFRFDRHSFVPGEYVSITEHDGAQRTFRVVEVAPVEG